MAWCGAALVGLALAAVSTAWLLPRPLNVGVRKWSLAVVRAEDGSLRVVEYGARSPPPQDTVAVAQYEHFRLDRERWTLGRRGVVSSFVTQPAAAISGVEVGTAWNACAAWLAEHDPLLPDPVPAPGVVTRFAVTGDAGDLLLQQFLDALSLARWLAVVGIALLSIALVRRLASSPYRRRGECCEACGYALQGSDGAVCPECGAALLGPGERRLEG